MTAVPTTLDNFIRERDLSPSTHKALISTFGAAPIIVCDLSGGVVHRVTRIISDRKSIILKQRFSYCHTIPSAPLNAEDILYEAHALKRMAKAMSNVWPTVIHFDQRANALLLSDLADPRLCDGVNYISVCDINRLEIALRHIARTLAAGHKELARIDSFIALRPDGDEAFFERNLFERVTYHRLSSAETLASELRKLTRQMIIGDFQPKNMLVCEDYFRCFDLEHAHLGPQIFDLGFFLGHIALHRICFDGTKTLARMIDLTCTAYNIYNPLDSQSLRLLGPLIFASMAYRLSNPIVPYNLQIEPSCKALLADRAISGLVPSGLSPGCHFASVA